MSYDHKIIDQKYHLKGLINKDICNKLIKFYEDHKNMAIPEDSYKFNEDTKTNTKEIDNCSFLNISVLRNQVGFTEPYEIILKYLRIVLTNYEIHIRNNLCPTYQNVFMTMIMRVVSLDFLEVKSKLIYLQVRLCFSLLSLFGFMELNL